MAKRQTTAAPGLTRKQASRARREARIQRIVLISTGVIALAVIGLIGYALVNTLVIGPRKALATVNDQQITVKEFQNRVLFEDYLYQLQPYHFSAFNPVSVIDQMVEELILRQKAKEMGIEVSDADVLKQAQLLAGYDAPPLEPTSTLFPTLLPTSDASPTATSTYVYTPTPIPTATLAPGETPIEDPTATEEATAESTVEPTTGPTETPVPTATPITEEDNNKRFDEILSNGATFTGLTKDQIKLMWLQRVKDDLIRTKVSEKVEYHLEDKKILVHAAHILVATEDEAKDVVKRLEKGEEFEKLAAELSTDQSNAIKGGDLGWLKHGDTVEAFEKVAFATPPGKISDPVQTQFGWHIIKVYDKVEQPTDAYDKESQKQEQFDQMIKDWRNAATVNIDDSYPTYVPTLPNTQQQ